MKKKEPAKWIKEFQAKQREKQELEKTKKYYKKDEPRFSFQELDEETNIPDLQSWVNNREMEGLVDEESGGIIGYINRGHVEKLYTILNKMRHEKK